MSENDPKDDTKAKAVDAETPKPAEPRAKPADEVRVDDSFLRALNASEAAEFRCGGDGSKPRS
ncbi:MAG: hypothetical protein KDD53_02545 [Bdellovibrionales bacterium]|nr:hypothetical protein [Bdellovibrionales bacterium]